MNRIKNKIPPLNKRMIMQKILDIRYTDVEEENRLCKELLGIVEPNQEFYECAFAHVYLMDSFLAMGCYPNCVYHLNSAEELCRKNGYDDLLVILCNLAGLYYTKLNNEQCALKYHLDGLTLAEKLGDIEMRGKHYNNIGLAFSYRGAFDVGKRYFELAFEMMSLNLNSNTMDYAVNCLCNIIEACEAMGDYEEAYQVLKKCESMGIENTYCKMRIALIRISYFEKMGDCERCMEQVQKTINSGFLEYPDKFFVSYMLEGIVESVIKIKRWKEAKHYLDILDEMEIETSLVNRYQIQCLKIKYWKENGDQKEYEMALKRYYEIMKQMTTVNNEMCVQSMVSQIDIIKTQWERQRVRRENEELERYTQLDALTGLYNRRYLNKLVSKIFQQKDLIYLGYIMLDLDYFKQYNDFYGHFNGDKALITIAQTLSEQSVEGISAGRYGGDEFFCLCINLTTEKIADYIERVRNSLKEKNIPHEKSKCSDRLTLSIGYYNTAIKEGKTIEEILSMADDALYEVKNAGRNGVAKMS